MDGGTYELAAAKEGVDLESLGGHSASISHSVMIGDGCRTDAGRKKRDRQRKSILLSGPESAQNPRY